MKTRVEKPVFINIDDIFDEVPYYMSYMKDTVLWVLQWAIGLDEMMITSQEKYKIALKESQDRDRLYESGAMWRLAISEWWPNEIQDFIPERDRCLEILEKFGIK